MTRVLVCGGRDFNALWLVWQALDNIHGRPNAPITCVIEGGATGPDRFAREWAEDRGVPVRTFAAHWKTHGKRAGPLRNQRMIDEGKPDLVIAFEGGRGTDDMVRRAKASKINLIEYGR